MCGEMVKDDPKKVRCKLSQQLMSNHSTATNMALHLKRVSFFFFFDHYAFEKTQDCPLFYLYKGSINLRIAYVLGLIHLLY